MAFLMKFHQDLLGNNNNSSNSHNNAHDNNKNCNSRDSITDYASAADSVSSSVPISHFPKASDPLALHPQHVSPPFPPPGTVIDHDHDDTRAQDLLMLPSRSSRKSGTNSFSVVVRSLTCSDTTDLFSGSSCASFLFLFDFVFLCFHAVVLCLYFFASSSFLPSSLPFRPEADPSVRHYPSLLLWAKLQLLTDSAAGLRKHEQ